MNSTHRAITVGNKSYQVRQDGSQTVVFWQSINQATGQPWQARRDLVSHSKPLAAYSDWMKRVRAAKAAR